MRNYASTAQPPGTEFARSQFRKPPLPVHAVQLEETTAVSTTASGLSSPSRVSVAIAMAAEPQAQRFTVRDGHLQQKTPWNAVADSLFVDVMPFCPIIRTNASRTSVYFSAVNTVLKTRHIPKLDGIRRVATLLSPRRLSKGPRWVTDGTKPEGKITTRLQKIDKQIPVLWSSRRIFARFA
jgi:hypothetical protein